MVKKDMIYKWDKREKDAFSPIKKSIAKPLAFYSLGFNKYCMFYTFASDTSLVAMLTQKDDMFEILRWRGVNQYLFYNC